ncbi:transposase [Gammaproteobacteria bacterium]
MFIDLEQVFSDLDDAWKKFKEEWDNNSLSQELQKMTEEDPFSLLAEAMENPLNNSVLVMSEIMTIIVAFHMSNYRTFKHFYINFVQKYWKDAFPNLVSYYRFIALQKTAIIPLCIFLNQRKGEVTGISYIDSTTIIVCHNKRIHSNKVFKNLAKRGKNSIGWFYGFKLHLVVSDQGDLLAAKVTQGNIDDREPVNELTKDIIGKLFGDKGYISQSLFEELFGRGLQLITKIKKNMKNKLIPILDKILLRKRAIIETINDQLKNISQIEHTRHRSVTGFMVNMLGGLIAYTYRDNKPSIQLNEKDLEILSKCGVI